jgi:hypothetical protein
MGLTAASRKAESNGTHESGLAKARMPKEKKRGRPPKSGAAGTTVTAGEKT